MLSSWFRRPNSRGVRLRSFAASILGFSWLIASHANAVPAFAAQTGQPCQSCHVGGLGPQLTPFGRQFKLHGYTMRSSEWSVPVSAMAVASYVATGKVAASPPAPGFKRNDNTALDQVSLFFAGGFGPHLGAFVQTTYDGVGKAWSWDNVDVRSTATFDLKGVNILVGGSLNNSPTVQDAWNTLSAWGYPYTTSGLAPSPAASPMLNGGFAQTSLGLTGYAWINSSVLLEGGAYGSPDRNTLAHLGADPLSPGAIHGLAPYGRAAFQQAVAGGTLEVGAFGMSSEIYPARDRSAGVTDHYDDLGADASFYKALANGDVVTLNGRYLHEHQSLRATCELAAAGPDCVSNRLTDLRADASYYWRNHVGGTVALFDTHGTANPTLYADNRTFLPDSSGMMLQLDETPFGEGSPFGPRFNMRVGVQYTLYSRFDGARSNYDGAGAKASDNNTFRVFTWLAY